MKGFSVCFVLAFAMCHASGMFIARADVDAENPDWNNSSMITDGSAGSSNLNLTEAQSSVTGLWSFLSSIGIKPDTSNSVAWGGLGDIAQALGQLSAAGWMPMTQTKPGLWMIDATDIPNITPPPTVTHHHPHNKTSNGHISHHSNYSFPTPNSNGYWQQWNFS